ncbi:thiamine pyrophosphate-dependent enzyme [Thalassococcus sp. S3]|uniref:thiamine pyrophosphate-dependent enzyme n=1 Tax=Thalassococcus sp. S3 TaxID=2017482 RepID=UPI0013EEC090
MLAARLNQAGRVIAVGNDGDVMMNIQEMETAHRIGLSLALVAWVDGAIGLIEDRQERDTGDCADLSFNDIAWDQLAKAFCRSHVGCRTRADLRDALVADAKKMPPFALSTYL